MAMISRIRRRHKPPFVLGSPPGTLVSNPEYAKPQVTLIGYDNEGSACKSLAPGADFGQQLAAFRERWRVTWVNVDGLGDIEVIQQLGDIFGLHRLALEDVLSLRHRPKIEEYPGHLFLIVQMLEGDLPVNTEQLSVFAGEGFVITFQEHPGDCLDPVRTRIKMGRGRVREMGADYLAYALLDVVIDAYYPLLDRFSEEAEKLQEDVLSHPDSGTVARVHGYKRDLLTLRRALSPLREVTNALQRDVGPFVTDTTRVYVRDCYDHTIQLLDVLETYREIISGLLDVYLSSVSNKMNQVMKFLTIIATLFIPLSFVTGVFGMNFNTEVSPFNMPELDLRYGYLLFWFVVLAVVVGEIALFKHLGWLTGDDSAASPKRHPDDKEGHEPRNHTQ